MAATPPLQIRAEARTPPTPLHGSAYHDYTPSRYQTRSSFRKASEVPQTAPRASLRDSRATRTSTPPHQVSSQSFLANVHSPRTTPRHKSAQRAQFIAPPSPDLESSAPHPAPSQPSQLPPYLSATTMIPENMLPTPVKTPKKKIIPKSSIAARALFQDPAETEETMQSPRHSRKTKRHNGFSLEQISTEGDADKNSIQIFTDSRDNIPDLDTSEENPFLDQKRNAKGSSTRKIAGTSKRRKLSGETKKDPQVEEAIEQDDGMVYVFRGKKVYRRFDDAGEEEEEIDIDDLGLLGDLMDGPSAIRKLKTLTRKSIKPTRLFETETQKRARKVQEEEEAETDIEVDHIQISATKMTGNAVKDVEQSASHPVGEGVDSAVETLNEPDQSRMRTRAGGSNHRAKKCSPFDSWPRVKAGTTPPQSSTSKGKKRAAPESNDEVVTSTGKRTKVA